MVRHHRTITAEIYLRDGHTYRPENVPHSTVVLHRGCQLADVYCVTQHGTLTKVCQYHRDANGKVATFLGKPLTFCAYHDSRHVKLKVMGDAVTHVGTHRRTVAVAEDMERW